MLFDVYGTMFISGSGDVGSVASPPQQALHGALEQVGIAWLGKADQTVHPLRETIRSHHEAARRNGIPHPEVDILTVWRDSLVEMQQRDWIDVDLDSVNIAELAAHYEARANPVWPMPGLSECLEALRQRHLLGIVSNAQFFTLDLFPAFLNKSVFELGFREQLSIWSFQHLRAKPDSFLFRLALEALHSHGVDAGQTLFLGNDMLNDVMPAKQAGFATALFAGDQRSLRLRDQDERVSGVRPDVIVTSLKQLVDIV